MSLNDRRQPAPSIMMRCAFFVILSFLDMRLANADNNILTGANDILAVIGEEGEIKASPFSVQFGKKDIWLPRSGHTVSMEVNNKEVPVGMILDTAGQAYFPTREVPMNRQYRFWSALLGFGDPTEKHRTNTLTPSQLSTLGLVQGPNSLHYRVTTESGNIVRVGCVIHLVTSNRRLVISDIDGTVTRTDVSGIILPALGLSDWKHPGVVELYSQIAEQGYLVLYLTNRPIGQSSMTRDYIYSLTEDDKQMPRGPVLLQVESLVGALQAEVFSDGQPEVNKIAALSRIRGLFSSNPFYAGFGNRDWDIMAYKAIRTKEERIFRVDQDSRIYNEGTGVTTNYTQLIRDVQQVFPVY